MTLLGTLLRNRRAGEVHVAWNQPQLQGPELLSVTSRQFVERGTIPLEHCGRMVGGTNQSPQLAWSPPPAGTAQLLLVVEDTDVPTSKPAVHCLALIDSTVEQLDPGALAAKQPAAGVRICRSTIGRGYQGPGPIKGHGPHHYTFQLFALGGVVDAEAARARPRALLAALDAPVLARGRLIGVYER
ncbi:YbhB/YbcL family Raf kinase inhibitor-like protein [Streptacidiphilus sp. N1-12]|uniref:YbhB/YbcL family Raf kinase inhibitor-like protein n=2 Tax=Streptacidiphilus alkalitolerans TaxID=3342712 RepID=A0ABV6V8E7_9ACTN